MVAQNMIYEFVKMPVNQRPFLAHCQGHAGIEIRRGHPEHRVECGLRFHRDDRLPILHIDVDRLRWQGLNKPSLHETRGGSVRW